MNKLKTLLKLFLSFFKIGLFTFGGGYAMIALLKSEFVDKKQWIENDEFLDIIAIAESTPGPIAINSATYIGYKMGKFWGSLLSTLGVVLPSFIIIFVISLFFNQFMEIKLVEYAFHGIQACVAFLILSAGLKMIKGLKKDWLSISLLSVTIILMVLFSLFSVKFSSILYIVCGGLVGGTVYLVNYLMHKKKKSAEITEQDNPSEENNDKEEM